MTTWCNRCVVQQCTGLIKSNRPLYVSVSHRHGIGLSDFKFLRCIAYVIDVLLAKFQIHTMSHIVAKMSIWTNALFTVQIQVCQLVVEPRNHTAGCVICVGHVSSIACFYHQYLQHNLCYKELHAFIEDSKNLHMTAKYEPRGTRTYWMRRRPQ